MKKSISLLAALLLFMVMAVEAQQMQPSNSPNGGSQSFLLAGEAESIFSASKDGNSFEPLVLVLMPLARINDRLFLESGLKMEMDDGGDFTFGLEALNLHYRINPWLTFHFGKFAAPWGNVLDMFGEGFVSRFPVSPIGLSDDGMAPTDQVGLGFQGGIQAGNTKLLYDLYLSNGPQLIVDDGSAGGEENLTGHMSYESLVDNNKNKAIGGKIGILPFPNSSLQVDAFAQTAAKTGDTGSEYEGVSSTSYGFDLNYYKTFDPILVRVMGQFESTKTDNQTYSLATDTTSVDYTFDNTGNSWYLAATLRPTGSKNTFLSNLELGARYVTYSPPEYALWGGDKVTQLTIGLTYWLTWSSQVNFGYDIIKEGDETSNLFIVRGVYKF
jgi:hypothetical protein